MDKETGLKELIRIVKDDVRHKDYARVVELADLYYKLTSGDGIEDLLSQVMSRETEDEFKLRKAITASIIPPVLASTKLPFHKVSRKKPKIRTLDWESGDTEKKKSELEASIALYWGDASLDRFLEYALVDYNYTDPNAFLITEFAPFDPKKEKAEPYPFIATSDQVIMFKEDNNIVDYVVVMLPMPENKHKFTMYMGMETIRLTEVEDRIPDAEVYEINDKFYLYEYFQPKNKKVPARRFGYKRDPQTQGRTFVSCFHDIIPYLKKTLKIDSELDLTTAMTAFPQRFAYVSPCQEKGCNKGYLPSGEICTVCDGSGKEPFHSTASDVITLDLPRDPQDIINLEQLLVYKSPPIELLNFQKDYIEHLKHEVYLMMFNKELFSKTEIAQTATEKILETDNMNDTLRPFATGYSILWEFVVRDIATFTDLGEGLIAHHQFPEDFKFKGLVELVNELKIAKDAGASTTTIAAIEDDINELLYFDRPDELKAIRIKGMVNPFRGYREADIRLIISQGMTTERNAVLWSNLEAIFNELENETDIWLYDLSTEKILELVETRTESYIEQIKAEKPTVNDFRMYGTE